MIRVPTLLALVAVLLPARPDDPNVLSDQGVMYRELGRYDKALANFRKAKQIDPQHLQSLFAMGVVYLNDLKQPKRRSRRGRS